MLLFLTHLLEYFLLLELPLALKLFADLAYFLSPCILSFNSLLVLLTRLELLFYFFVKLLCFPHTFFIPILILSRVSDTHPIFSLVLSIQILPEITSPLLGFDIMLSHNFIPKVFCHFPGVINLICDLH